MYSMIGAEYIMVYKWVLVFACGWLSGMHAMQESFFNEEFFLGTYKTKAGLF